MYIETGFVGWTKIVCQNALEAEGVGLNLNPGPAEPRYALSLQTV